MRAHITTTRSGRRRKARNSVLALALGVCALAIPATVSAKIDYSTQPDDDGAVAAGNAHRTPTELAQTTAAGEPTGSSQPGGGAVATGHPSPNAIKGGHDVIPGYASADAITGAEPFTGAPPARRPAQSSGSTCPAPWWARGPRWLWVALGEVAFLTVRRRTEVSPSRLDELTVTGRRRSRRDGRGGTSQAPLRAHPLGLRAAVMRRRRAVSSTTAAAGERQGTEPDPILTANSRSRLASGGPTGLPASADERMVTELVPDMTHAYRSRVEFPVPARSTSASSIPYPSAPARLHERRGAARQAGEAAISAIFRIPFA